MTQLPLLPPHEQMPDRFADFCVHVRSLRESAGVRPATLEELRTAFDFVWTAFPP